MKTRNAVFAIIAMFAIATALPSCSTTQDCWAYRSGQKYNQSKHRPSIAGAKGVSKARLRMY